MSDDASHEWDGLSELAQKISLERVFELPSPLTRKLDEGLSNDERYVSHVLRMQLERDYLLPSPGALEEKRREERALQEQQSLVDQGNEEQPRGEPYLAHPTLQKVAKWLRVSPRLSQGTRPATSHSPGVWWKADKRA